MDGRPGRHGQPGQKGDYPDGLNPFDLTGERGYNKILFVGKISKNDNKLMKTLKIMY
jgi:hypothetical protein